MNCPSCGQSQPNNATECAACGVIFAKWKARAEAQAAAPAVSSAAAPPGAQDAPLDWGAAVKGAVVGGVASVIESMVVAIPFMKGTPRSAEEAEAMVKALTSSMSYLMTDLGASLLCMAIGGYVAAGSAGHSPVKHGGAAGVLLIFIIGGMYLIAPSVTPGWYNAAVFILIVPAAMLGALLRG